MSVTIDGAPAATTGDQVSPITVLSNIPSGASDWALYLATPGGVTGPMNNDVPAPWTRLGGIAFNGYASVYERLLSSAAAVSASQSIANASGEFWGALLFLYNVKPATHASATNGGGMTGPVGGVWTGTTNVLNCTGGDDVFVSVNLSAVSVAGFSVSITDDEGLTYQPEGSVVNPGGTNHDATYTALWRARGARAGAKTVTIQFSGPTALFSGANFLQAFAVDGTVGGGGVRLLQSFGVGV